MSDRIGRKKTMLLTGIPNAVGWILISVSPYTMAAGSSVFKVIILTGRFLTGVACSGIYAAVPVSYWGELERAPRGHDVHCIILHLRAHECWP